MLRSQYYQVIKEHFLEAKERTVFGHFCQQGDVFAGSLRFLRFVVVFYFYFPLLSFIIIVVVVVFVVVVVVDVVVDTDKEDDTFSFSFHCW